MILDYICGRENKTCYTLWHKANAKWVNWSGFMAFVYIGNLGQTLTMKKLIKEVDNWKNLRTILVSSYGHSENWTEAVNLFDKRIQSKYFLPIDSLITNPNLRKQGEGFPIVTIQCALIETFAAFREGLIYNHNKPEFDGLTYEYRDSRELFVRFLNSALIFKDIFYTLDKNRNKQINIPFSAIQFYSHVRCGLMHETRTKGNWVINATANDNPSDKKFIKRGIKGNIIYRTLFQIALINYFESYKSDLQNTHNAFNPLRRLFARKLDHLYDIKDNYEWWTA